MDEQRSQRVKYFGHWAEDANEARAVRAALRDLAELVGNAGMTDARGAKLTAALTVVGRHMTRPAIVKQFKQALELPDPGQRSRAAQTALEAIYRNLGVQVI